jgi:sugar phosphate isomerase/epimerase
MKRKFSIISLLLAICFITQAQNVKPYDDSALDKLGWRLAVQAWTFRLFTLTETLDKCNELGIKYIELFPRQEIGGGIEGTTAYTMDEQTRRKLKELLDKKGVKVVNYGVVGGNTEEEWVQIFEFATAMGIETINSEPAAKFIPLIETLCDKYKVQLAVHNHPKPTRYWHPDLVNSVVVSRTNRMGVCGDIGHWVRSGLDPIECIQKLDGRLLTFHIKDLNQFGVRQAHDIPWGTGNCNLAGIMHTLKNMNFKGTFSIEYEYNWENSMPEVAESIEYFYRVASRLAKE